MLSNHPYFSSPTIYRGFIQKTLTNESYTFRNTEPHMTVLSLCLGREFPNGQFTYEFVGTKDWGTRKGPF